MLAISLDMAVLCASIGAALARRSGATDSLTGSEPTVSYILDALRRADAERQRGAVPGLHDPAGALPAGAPAGVPIQAPGRSPWPWLAGAALLLVAVGGAWWLGRGTVAVPAPAAAVTPPVAVPVPVQVQVQLTPPPPAAPAAVAPAPPAPRPALLPAAVPPSMPPSAVAPSAPTSPAVAAPPAAAQAVAPAEPAADAVRAWASLPEAMRSTMPALAWSGAVHAERAEQRLVIVNGQVAREGDTIASGVQLLQIRPKSVLLRWQGQRIEMPL